MGPKGFAEHVTKEKNIFSIHCGEDKKIHVYYVS